MNEQIHIAAGRFVVKLATQTINGLSADAVLQMLVDEPDAVEQLFVIHRVTPEGRMELVGTDPSALMKPDCLMFSSTKVADARRDYDAIVNYANETPPPCRIGLQFGHAKSLSPPHIVMMLFPNACQTAVGGWLTNAPFDPGEIADGSQHALDTYEAASPQIVLSSTLEPQSRSPSAADDE